MRISLKNMLISFVLSLVVFSVVMTAVCVSIFRSRVDVRENDGGNVISAALPSRKSIYDLHQARLYYDFDSEGELRSAALIGICISSHTMTVTPIESSLPIRYQNGIYYLSSICNGGDPELLAEAVSSVTGVSLTHIVDASVAKADGATDAEALCDQIVFFLSDGYNDYSIERVDIVLDEDGVIDNDKTTANFFTYESN